MIQFKKIQTPLTDKIIDTLNAGDSVFLSGTIYTARDAAHQLMVEAIEQGEPLPFDIRNQIIFYAGPAPAPQGAVIGSVGPTTAVRMDAFTPPLLERGLKGMIGKGERGEAVQKSIQENHAVYFAAIGGAAALMAQCVKQVEIVAYPELGTEAIRKMVVEDLPLVVGVDAFGENVYHQK